MGRVSAVTWEDRVMLAQSIEDGEYNAEGLATFTDSRLTSHQIEYELRANSIEGSYEAHSAQILADERLRAQLGSKIRQDPLLEAFVRRLLAEGECDKGILTRIREARFGYIPCCVQIGNFRKYVAMPGLPQRREGIVPEVYGTPEPAGYQSENEESSTILCF